MKQLSKSMHSIHKSYAYSIVLSLVFLLTLGSCSKKKEAETKQEQPHELMVSLQEDQYKVADIQTGKTTFRKISKQLKVNGVIDVPPQNMVSVSMPMGGYLKSTKLLPGMPISKGEVIAVMQDQSYIQLQQDYLTALAQTKSIDEEYKRQKSLNENKSSSDKQYQQSEANYKMHNIQLKALAEKLQLIGINPEKLTEATLSRNINLCAPITGFVSKVNVNVGKFVNPTDVLFELVNPNDIHLSLTVFERDLENLAEGQKVIAYTNNHPEKRYACEIILIGKDLNLERFAVVHCHFKQYDKSLKPGTYMNALIETQSDHSTVLPEDAIVRSNNKEYIFAVRPERHFQLTEVKTGNTENGFTEVTAVNGEDLSKDTYVLKGAYSLLMKMKNKADE